MSRARICFVNHNIISLLEDAQSSKFMGGSELQQFLLGEQFVDSGYDVSFVTKDVGLKDLKDLYPFSVYPTFKENEGFPFIRFFYPRLYKIMMALVRADADIYYVRGAGFVVAAVVIVAKIKNKKVVFCGADDPDFDKSKVRLKHKRDRVLYFWGLKRCDLIISQNQKQKEQLLMDFGRKSYVIHNGFKRSNHAFAPGETILWVANFRRPKRPGMVLELARRLPGQKFVMIGGSAGSDSAEQNLYFEVLEKSRAINNLELKGFQEIDEVKRYLLNCKMLINTSLHEGFPNTFLQAWSQGVPVLSFCDPDDLIKTKRLGLVATTLDDMAKKIKLICDGDIYTSPEYIKTFFEKNLSIEKVSSEYIKIFEELMGCNGGNLSH